MSNSFKELSMAEPLPYPTLTDLPSALSLLLPIEVIDERLAGLNSDVFNMCKLATELKQSVLYLDCKIDFYRGYGVRLMSLINCIIENYGVNCYYYLKLVSCIRSANNKWKRLLFKNIRLLGASPMAEDIFLHKTERNTYYLSMIRTFNTTIEKIIEKLLVMNKLNIVAKKYLKAKGLDNSYRLAYSKIIEVLNEKQEETPLKVLLVNEFIKYILNFVHFCTSQAEQLQVFQHFYGLAIYLCRMLKKFYSQSIMKMIEDSLKLIYQGLEKYILIFEKRPNYVVKIQKVFMLLQLIEPKKSFNCSPLMNENSFVIRLLTKILFNWRKFYLRSEKLRSLNMSKEFKQLSMVEYIRKEKEKKLKSNLYNDKPSKVTGEMIKISKSLSNLNRRKSVSKNQFNIGTKMATGSETFPLNNVIARTDIERDVNHYFSRVNSLKLSRAFSSDKKKEVKGKNSGEGQKELKLEDYASFYYNKKKVVQTINKIQLYKPQKMADYYRTRPKQRLKLQ